MKTPHSETVTAPNELELLDFLLRLRRQALALSKATEAVAILKKAIRHDPKLAVKLGTNHEELHDLLAATRNEHSLRLKQNQPMVGAHLLITGDGATLIFALKEVERISKK